jgi:hypothetical protein
VILDANSSFDKLVSLLSVEADGVESAACATGVVAEVKTVAAVAVMNADDVFNNRLRRDNSNGSLLLSLIMLTGSRCRPTRCCLSNENASTCTTEPIIIIATVVVAIANSNKHLLVRMLVVVVAVVDVIVFFFFPSCFPIISTDQLIVVFRVCCHPS